MDSRGSWASVPCFEEIETSVEGVHGETAQRGSE